MKFIKALVAHPLRFRIYGKVKENDRVEVEDLDIGIVWVLLFILCCYF